jgi:hypothetical protein
MDEQLRGILIDLLASEDPTGCSNDLTVVEVAPIRRLRDYMRSTALQAPLANRGGRQLWRIEVARDGLVRLTLTRDSAALVASALEIVNPDDDRETRNARALALGLQMACDDA